MSEVLTRLQAALADRYRIERELGRGGMATVYLANDLRHDRSVALKVLRPELAHVLGPDRFLREIRLCARLQHPHILGVHDSGEAGGQLWFTMPFVEGETLRSRLDREQQLPLDDALQITSEVADALSCAHQHGVIHRDIKPENILLSGNHALVADFGIARALGGEEAGKQVSGKGERLTETGMSLGTPHYMSPEQATGERELDQRTDVYSLGCVLYEMLTGEPPFTGPNAQSVLAKKLSSPAPHVRSSREVSPAIDAVVTRALSRAAADRFRSTADFVRALYEPGHATTPLVGPASKTRSGVRSLLALALGLLIGLGVLFAWPRDRFASVDPESQVKRVAVLPFDNLGGSDKEYFANGITDEVRGKLAGIPGLQVTARTSSSQYRHTAKSPQEIGRELGVDYLLTGTVRWNQEGDRSRVRVSPELVQATSGATRWQQAFDAPLTDVFHVQANVAARVAHELGVAMGAAQRQHMAERPTSNLAAYDLYLRGRHAWHQRTAEGLNQARYLLEQAIQLDPRFALAHSGLADVYVVLPLWRDLPPDQTYPRAKAAALRALSLDSTLAAPLATLADVNAMYEWDWDAAERRFLESIALDPNNANTYLWYTGDYLFAMSRGVEAVEKIRRARELDPLSVMINAAVGQDLYRIGRREEAKAQLRAVLSLDPGFRLASLWLGQIYLSEGRSAEAIPLLEQAIDTKVRQSNEVAMLGFGYAKAGRRAEARSLLRELLNRRSRGYVSPANIALLIAGMGDTVETFRWLQRAVDIHDPFLIYNFVTEPLLEAFRRDPRGVAILRAMGIPHHRQLTRTPSSSQNHSPLAGSVARSSSGMMPPSPLAVMGLSPDLFRAGTTDDAFSSLLLSPAVKSRISDRLY